MVGHAQPTVDLFTHYAAAGAVWPTGESANNAPELVQRLFRFPHKPVLHSIYTLYTLANALRIPPWFTPSLTDRRQWKNFARCILATFATLILMVCQNCKSSLGKYTRAM